MKVTSKERPVTEMVVMGLFRNIILIRVALAI